MLRVLRLIFVHINVQNYASLIDEHNNIAQAGDDEWPVISRVWSLNVSLHWDYHVCMVCDIYGVTYEEIN